MTTVVEVKLPEEKNLDETTVEETVIDQALEVLEVATVIAEKLDEAGEDDDGVIEVLARLTSIETMLAALFVRIDEVVALVSKPAEIVVEAPVIDDDVTDVAPDVVVEAEDNSTVVVESEEVPEVITPQTRVKKQRKWI